MGWRMVWCRQVVQAEEVALKAHQRHYQLCSFPASLSTLNQVGAHRLQRTSLIRQRAHPGQGAPATAPVAAASPAPSFFSSTTSRMKSMVGPGRAPEGAGAGAAAATGAVPLCRCCCPSCSCSSCCCCPCCCPCSCCSPCTSCW